MNSGRLSIEASNFGGQMSLFKREKTYCMGCREQSTHTRKTIKTTLQVDPYDPDNNETYEVEHDEDVCDNCGYYPPMVNFIAPFG